MANCITNITELDEILDSLTEELEEDDAGAEVKAEAPPPPADAPILTGPFFQNNIIPTQKTLIDSIRKIIKHVVQHERIIYLVAYNTVAFGGNRWFADQCLFRRPQLIINYWQKKAIKSQRETDNTMALYTISQNTFSVYDF